MKWHNNWKTVGLISLGLGLAPFYPEPHLWGKIKWIIGGAEGMSTMDWLDVVQHGAPFLLLIRLMIISVRNKVRASKA